MTLATKPRLSRGITLSAMEMTLPRKSKIRSMKMPSKWSKGLGWKVVTFLSLLGWASIFWVAWVMS